MKPRRGKARPDRHKRARRAPGGGAEASIHKALEAGGVLSSRELFWQNVMREILSSLAMLCAQRPRGPNGEPLPSAPGGAEPGAELASETGEKAEEPFPEEMFDGRLAVITTQSQRISIADVLPLFACSIPTPGERALVFAVECTVFQIRTPSGEVFTLPLSELREFHSLTPELMKRLEGAARRQARVRGVRQDERIPFGFAAFTSLARGGPSIVPPAPEHPTE